ncbi:MAG TPA: class IV adenylate cyclase [Phototrophicaceae bacterium]|jgi:adenylate cyclase class 2|nr:class IV adenylate cyclase [Phototrophicaceae bacterium]
MSSSYNETEVKLYVPDLKSVAEKLESLGAKLVAPRVYERNMRYENAAATLTKSGIVVRLRQDTRVRLTYKEPPTGPQDSDITSRYEAEVEVSDFGTMQTILGKLGYFPHVVYEKYRTTYTLDGVEVVLDEMPYGNFVEIEGDADAIRQAMERLGLQFARRFAGNYLSLFDLLSKRLKLKFENLTFANFEQVRIPDDVIEDIID